MKVLIIGRGGKEHAIAWKIAKSETVSHIYVAPGNAGTYREPKVENVDIDELDFDALIKFVKTNKIALTIVGPEAPLVTGIVDKFNEAELTIFGPNQKCSQLEGSKSFAKDFMLKYGIPCAKFKTFTNPIEAKKYVESHSYPLVIKANGLTSGKGVVVATSFAEALSTIEDMLEHEKHGQASKQIIIEEYLQGAEASFIVAVNGKNVMPLATSQDHKARDNNDNGPNTGGMGAYSPAPIINHQLHETIMQTIINPTLAGLEKEGLSYLGFLYAGLMLTKEGEIKVLEYNCRLGDPESQVILMRLNSDFLELIQHTMHGNLDEYKIKWDEHFSLGVVMAAKGYPRKYQKGDKISHLKEIPSNPNYKIFHNGTKIKESDIVTNGGRVLCVCALGDSITKAQEKAYQLVNKISFKGAFYRNDIGYKAIENGKI